MVKRCQNIFYWVKKTCLGVLDIEEIRAKDNATGLKEGGVIEMSIYSAFHIRDARSPFAFVYYLPPFPCVPSGMLGSNQ